MSKGFGNTFDDVTIAIGNTVSRVVSGALETADAVQITLQAPSSLEAGTYTFEVSNVYNADPANYADADFVTLNDGSADIGPPAAGKGRSYTEMVGFHAWRIVKNRFCCCC